MIKLMQIILQYIPVVSDWRMNFAKEKWKKYFIKLKKIFA